MPDSGEYWQSIKIHENIDKGYIFMRILTDNPDSWDYWESFRNHKGFFKVPHNFLLHSLFKPVSECSKGQNVMGSFPNEEKLLNISKELMTAIEL